MVTAADTLARARPLVAALVEREERRCGSRMAAYDIIGGAIGKSPSWVRKLLGRQDQVAVELHDFLNIALAYRRLCQRVEGAAERERKRAAALRREANAALESTLVLVEGAAGASRSREGN